MKFYNRRSATDYLCRVNPDNGIEKQVIGRSDSTRDNLDRNHSDSCISNPDSSSSDNARDKQVRSHQDSTRDNQGKSSSFSSQDKPHRNFPDRGREIPALFLQAGSSVIIFFILFACSAQAQTFNAGVSAGISISQVEGDALSGYNKAGAAFGLFVNRDLREKLTAQFEINYISKGSQLKTTLEDQRYYRMELHYIEIPLLVKYLLSERFLAEAGLSGGYLFQSDEKDSLGEIPGTVAFRKTELAALAGISYLISEQFSINTRLSYSVIPIRKHAGGGTWFFNRGQNNNVLTFSLRYQF